MVTNYNILWSQTWGQMQDLGPVHRHTIRIVTETLSKLEVDSVLDVGCGNGAILEAIQLANNVEELCGIDISSQAISLARKRVNADLQTRDFLTEDLGRQFDFVICSQVIEHIQDDDLFLRRLRSITGRYCFVGTMQGRMRPSELEIGHVRNYTRKELEAKLKEAGFKVEQVIEWGFPFYSPFYRTISEYLPGNHQKADFSGLDRLAASLLYHVYRMNSSRRGDVIMALCSPASNGDR